MAFTATVLSPDADTQATVESDWEAGAEHKYVVCHLPRKHYHRHSERSAA